MSLRVISLTFIICIFIFSSCSKIDQISSSEPELKKSKNENSTLLKDNLSKPNAPNDAICPSPTIEWFEPTMSGSYFVNSNLPYNGSWGYSATELHMWYPYPAEVRVYIDNQLVYAYDWWGSGIATKWQSYSLTSYGPHTFLLKVKNHGMLNSVSEVSESHTVYLDPLWRPQPPSIYGVTNSQHPALGWAAVEGASGGYIIYKSLNPDGPFNQVASTSGLTYVDYNENNWDGITFPKPVRYYRVKALHSAGGISDFSNTLSRIVAGIVD